MICVCVGTNSLCFATGLTAQTLADLASFSQNVTIAIATWTDLKKGNTKSEIIVYFGMAFKREVKLLRKLNARVDVAKVS